MNVLHTRKPTHLNEATSDNIDEHAYIHESKGIATATIALIIRQQEINIRLSHVHEWLSYWLVLLTTTSSDYSFL